MTTYNLQPPREEAGADEQRSGRVALRIAVVTAVAGAVVIVAVLLFATSGSYSVKARFINAAQLVKGDEVQIGGVKVGSIGDIGITPDGQAEVTMSIDKDYRPLRRGTRATIRQASLSGIANRYVDLELPPGATTKANAIPDGGVIPLTQTTTAVDLDEVFNAFNPSTRKAVGALLHNSAEQFKGKAQEQRLAFHYLNPALGTSGRLFDELNRDNPLLTRFLQDSSRLVTDVAERRAQLAALIGNANRTFHALAVERGTLADAVGRLPDFMRSADTTFVDLRTTLDQLDPLVAASKPVAIKLRPFLGQLRPLARDAKPTVRDLSNIVRKPGPSNDLTELTRTFPPLESTALKKADRKIDEGGGPVDVGTVPGAFPTVKRALNDAAPVIAAGRPYTPDLFGWFDDFATSGTYDALGGWPRSLNVINATSATDAVPSLLPLDDRGLERATGVRTGQYRRCPGGSEMPAPDGSNVWSAGDQQKLGCREADRAVGDVK